LLVVLYCHAQCKVSEICFEQTASADIDGKFGRIWKLLKMCFVNSPDDFIATIKKAFTTGKVGASDNIRAELDRLGVGRKVKIFELFAIPDNQKHFNLALAMDAYSICISQCFKQEWTQLQWTFEEIETGDDPELQLRYPNGVRVTYRSYAQDGPVIELHDRSEFNIDLSKVAKTPEEGIHVLCNLL